MKIMRNFYRCGIELEHPILTLAGTRREAMKSLGCLGCKEIGCGGPVTLEETMRKTKKEEQKVKQMKQKKSNNKETELVETFKVQAVAKKTEKVAPPLPLASYLPGIDAETDEAIRKELLELAAHPIAPSMAPKILEAYGGEIRSARESRRGWGRIAKVFRKHGMRVGENSLKARAEG